MEIGIGTHSQLVGLQLRLVQYCLVVNKVLVGEKES
jgi:hypothetical protein